MAINDERRKSSASPNWLAMMDAMELPVEVIDSGMLLVFPISIVTVMVSPNARPIANTYDEIYRNRPLEIPLCVSLPHGLLPNYKHLPSSRLVPS